MKPGTKILIAVLIVIIIGTVAFYFWTSKEDKKATDNAFKPTPFVKPNIPAGTPANVLTFNK